MSNKVKLRTSGPYFTQNLVKSTQLVQEIVPYSLSYIEPSSFDEFFLNV